MSDQLEYPLVLTPVPLPVYGKTIYDKISGIFNDGCCFRIRLETGYEILLPKSFSGNIAKMSLGASMLIDSSENPTHIACFRKRRCLISFGVHRDYLALLFRSPT